MVVLKLNPQNGSGRLSRLLEGGHAGLWKVTAELA